MKKSNVIGIIGAILGLAVIISIISWFLIGRNHIVLQGQAEATNYKASSKLSGRIEYLLVKEGQKVKKGDLLYILSTPEIDAKMRQAKAAEDAASAQERKANYGARAQEITAARNMWQKAQAGMELARKSFDRVKALYNEGVLPAQKYDEAEANYKASVATVNAAKAQYDLAVSGARSEDKASAEALVQQASGAVAEVEAYADDAKIYAPVDGEVSSIIAEQGELVGTGYPVVTIIDTDDIWATFNIKEDLMPRVKLGEKFSAFIPALNINAEFVVDYIASQADFATWSATKTQGGFDIRTFKVKAHPSTKIDGFRPGMSILLDWSDL